MSYELAILDDHPMICDAIEYQVHKHSSFNFAGRCDSLASANDLLSITPIDVLVCDLHLPDGMAVPLIRRLASETGTKVVVYTASEHPVISSICEIAGAVATLTKSQFGDDFLTRVHESLRVRSECSDSTDRVTNSDDPVDPRISSLTEREWDILMLMGQGLSTVEIASGLFISSKTVESHRAAIKRKLEVSSKDRLISMAARWIGIPA